jgi:Kef-type K+ transport system membrane component KefB
VTGVSFTNLVIVVAVAFAVPLMLGFVPKLPFPAVVLEVFFGIALGPSGLGWVKADLPVQLLALVGLAFLLFLAGMEVDLKRLRVLLLRLAGLGIALSLGLAASASYGLRPARMSPPP